MGRTISFFFISSFFAISALSSELAGRVQTDQRVERSMVDRVSSGLVVTATAWSGSTLAAKLGRLKISRKLDILRQNVLRAEEAVKKAEVKLTIEHHNRGPVNHRAEASVRELAKVQRELSSAETRLSEELHEEIIRLGRIYDSAGYAQKELMASRKGNFDRKAKSFAKGGEGTINSADDAISRYQRVLERAESEVPPLAKVPSSSEALGHSADLVERLKYEIARAEVATTFRRQIEREHALRLFQDEAFLHELRHPNPSQTTRIWEMTQGELNKNIERLVEKRFGLSEAQRTMLELVIREDDTFRSISNFNRLIDALETARRTEGLPKQRLDAFHKEFKASFPNQHLPFEKDTLEEFLKKSGPLGAPAEKNDLIARLERAYFHQLRKEGPSTFMEAYFPLRPIEAQISDDLADDFKRYREAKDEMKRRRFEHGAALHQQDLANERVGEKTDALNRARDAQQRSAGEMDGRAIARCHRLNKAIAVLEPLGKASGVVGGVFVYHANSTKYAKGVPLEGRKRGFLKPQPLDELRCELMGSVFEEESKSHSSSHLETDLRPLSDQAMDERVPSKTN